MNEIKQQMQDLISKIKQADNEYYVHNNPSLTDREYDQLRDELKNLEQEYNFVLPDSPTNKVSGDVLTSLEQVKHTKPMLSANKTKRPQEIFNFADSHDIVMSWKMDGLTLVLRYDNGKFQQAITRGREGIIGEDVTHTVKTFTNIPMTVPCKDKFEVRGEGIISWENFDKINQDLEEPYSHPRNLASGSVRQLDASKCKERNLEFFAFDLVTDMNFKTKTEQYIFMSNQGFMTVSNYLIVNPTLDLIEDGIKSMDPKDYAYPVDGLIFEIDNLALGQSLGKTGHHENRLMALKWADELFDTKFLGVELNTTRTGKVSITGIFEQIEIDHTKVNKASLHNLDIFNKFKFGIGDKITVYKANMIIPQIAENMTQSGTFTLPNYCPCCGHKLTIKTSVNDTHDLYCPNEYCSAKLVQRFVHFCSKTRMEINGLSKQTLTKFIENGWIKTFGDLYKLDQYKSEIIVTDGFGEKSYEKLWKSIQKSRNTHLSNFIAACGIPQVGRHAGKILEKYYNNSWDEFESALKANCNFTEIEDFGPVSNQNIHDWYNNQNERDLCLSALEFLNFEPIDTNDTIPDTIFSGKTVVTTGTLQHYSRTEIQAKLESLGAKVSNSVSKKTDYVIYGNKTGSKLTKAHDLGVKTLSEQEFENLVK